MRGDKRELEPGCERIRIGVQEDKRALEPGCEGIRTGVRGYYSRGARGLEPDYDCILMCEHLYTCTE